MKNIIGALLLAVSVNLTAAEVPPEPVKPITPQGFTYIGDTVDGKFSWYFVTSTFKVYNEGFSILTVRKTNDTGEASRMFLGVAREHCKLGYGSLKAREHLDQPWTDIFSFSVDTKDTVADVISNLICSVGMDITKDEKKISKKNQISI